MKKAFTLIELLVVIVIMAIIVGMSIPAFRGMGKAAEMNGTVRALCSTISLTRQWAITHRESAGVIVETNLFFAFRGDDKTMVSHSGVGDSAVKKAVAEYKYELDTTSTNAVWVWKLKRYFIHKTPSDVSSAYSYIVFDNLSDPVIFTGVVLNMKTKGKVVNGVRFKTDGGIKTTDDDNYVVECTNVDGTGSGKRITINLLTGGVHVSDR